MLRISVDTGGTFTDVVVLDAAGRLEVGKALTTPARVFDGLATALETPARALDASPADLLRDAELLIYGTTSATNAVVEKKTARTAFLTTEGFPDILLYREGGKPDPFAQIDFPPPYVPRYLTFEIRERIDSDGDIFVPLDEASVRDALALARAQHCEAIGVCLLWSIVNPQHELRVGELIEELLPGVPYTLSHRLNPVVREYRRASSTVIDASLKPLMTAHLEMFEDDLRRAGFAGELLVATSFGGTWHPHALAAKPIYAIGSGPSLAPIAAAAYVRAELDTNGEAANILVCDTGGTTFDVGVVVDGRVTQAAESWIGGDRGTGDIVGVSGADIKSIGAGGGSIIWLDSGGLLHVGPESAGADPGPACYGRGGAKPTITDAAVVLGYIDPDFFLGGSLRLDRDAACAAISEAICSRLPLSVEEAAAAAIEIATVNIVGAVKEITIARGLDPRELHLVGGGGAAGLNIVPIARELGCHSVLLPATAGALSAFGGQFADFVSEFEQPLYAETRDFPTATIEAVFARLEDDARAFLDGIVTLDLESSQIERWVEARYPGQVWELPIALSGPLSGNDELRALERAFDREHRRLFAVDDPGQHLECLSWKVRATGVSAKRPLRALRRGERDRGVTTAPAFFAETGLVNTRRYRPGDLKVGEAVAGPAVVLERTTSIVIYPGSAVTVTPLGNYLIDVSAESATAVPAQALERSGT